MSWNRRIVVRRFNQSIKSTVEEAVSSEASASSISVEEPKHECCICFEENVADDEKTECGHCVCSGCLDQMTKPVCPMCRAEIALSERAQDRIDIERNRKLKLRVYARLFRGIDSDFCDWVEYNNRVDNNDDDNNDE